MSWTLYATPCSPCVHGPSKYHFSPTERSRIRRSHGITSTPVRLLSSTFRPSKLISNRLSLRHVPNPLFISQYPLCPSDWLEDDHAPSRCVPSPRAFTWAARSCAVRAKCEGRLHGLPDEKAIQACRNADRGLVLGEGTLLALLRRGERRRRADSFPPRRQKLLRRVKVIVS